MFKLIKNFKELAKDRIKADLLEILEEGLKVANPRYAVKKALKINGGELYVKGRVFKLRGELFVIGFGKASFEMAKEIEEILGDRISGGAIITPFKPKEKLSKVLVLIGDHPIPTERNVTNARRILELVKDLREEDLVLVLISGGGSALFSLPPEGISIRDKARITELLMKSGADINELNAVRKHISLVKGGQLSKAIWPATTVSLIISDVVGDKLDTIASGPTAPDETTFKDAYDVLRRKNLLDVAPRSVVRYIEKGIRGEVRETPKLNDPIFSKTHNFIIASNVMSLKAMKELAVRKGYNSMIISSHVQGEAREVGKFISSIMWSIHRDSIPVSRPACIIMGGETTVTVKGSGVGGRNQELALSVGIEIEGMERASFASIGSDGVDGVSSAAGALVDGRTMKRARELNLDSWEFLDNNDSFTFFSKMKNAILTGPTGTNVNDFMVALLA